MSSKSAITRRPTVVNSASPADVESYINKGLQQPEKKVSKEKERKISHVSLRLDREKLEEIDGLLAKRRVKISRHLWFLEAIEEKIMKEEQEL